LWIVSFFITYIRLRYTLYKLDLMTYVYSHYLDRNITIYVSSHKLSKIEQLSTHMGIIQEGRLLEEIAFDKLRERNRNYLEFQVSDDNKAIMLLESQFGISDYEVHDEGNIWVYSHLSRQRM